MKARWWAEAAGAALLVMFPYFFPLVTPGNLVLYHHELSLRNVIYGELLDLAAVAVFYVLFLMIVLRLGPRARLITGALLAAGVLWRTGVFVATLFLGSQLNVFTQGGQNSSWFISLLQRALLLKLDLAAGLGLLFLSLAVATPALMRTIVRMTRFGLAGFGFSILWLAPELVYLAIRPSEPVTHAAVRQLPAATSNAPAGRLVWILFDELSYRLVFEQPPAGQTFPNLEKLHDQSLSFDKVEPVGFYTDRVIPSLLAGREIDEIRSTATGDLEVLGPRRRRWEVFDSGSSLFGLARRNGWNPGVAGWWNPYCRTFASELSDCYWRSAMTGPLEGVGASPEKSVVANALVLPEHLLASLAGRMANDTERDHNIEDYRSLMRKAGALIQNQQIHFVFLHLPVPHPPGIYDRNSHRLRAGGNYLDNLTLADDTLGELMQEIGASADGDRTTVIVSSDHSWRVPMWDASPGWTREEEEISHRAFDQRPVFLIHFPGETNGVEIRNVVPELEEHDIIAGILNGQIENGSQMAALLHTEKIRVARTGEERSEAGQ